MTFPPRAAVTSSLAVGLVGGLLGLSTAAHASPVDITCAVGSQTASYSPAMTNTTQPTSASITENYSCTSLSTAVSSGSTSAVFAEDAGCLLTAQPAHTAVTTYTWDTSATSTITFTVSNVVRAVDGTTTVTSLGSVTAGLGQGSLATRVIVLPALSLTACAGAGVSSQTGTATLSILP
ncbi:hypothetical protein GCM10009759_66010 [Kitasatospora saccharophila]|uniref:Ig-like domain-containing protein n=1 Tax=Kitasatospora saccharophila TaxID=407973 RepID=A0ABN2XXD6_9ACTN